MIWKYRLLSVKMGIVSIKTKKHKNYLKQLNHRWGFNWFLINDHNIIVFMFYCFIVLLNYVLSSAVVTKRPKLLIPV
jgi:hypothetical protein